MDKTATNSMVGTSKDEADAGRAATPQSSATRLIHLVAACSALLIGVIVAGTVAIIINLRAQALANTECELRNMALVLAEQIDRSFEAVVVLCNKRYIETYGLSPEIVKPGLTLRKLIEHQL